MRIKTDFSTVLEVINNGLDFRTVGVFKYVWNRLGVFLRRDRDSKEKEGLVPIRAAHSGYLTVGYNDDKKAGIYMRIRDEKKGIETLYFHLDRIRIFKGDHKFTKWEEIHGEDYVREKAIIGYSGNTGKYTTGAHLHFEVRIRKSGRWFSVDPMPYLNDEVMYQRIHNLTMYQRHFYKGEEITLKHARLIAEKLIKEYGKK